MSTRRAESGHGALAKQVEQIVMSTPVVDVHTHLYDPVFRDLLLRGIDDLLVYHYLMAEVFRYWNQPYGKFWSLAKPDQAEIIWNELFLKHSPISEACRGVLTTLHLLGLDVQQRDLPAVRKWFRAQDVEQQITRCLEIAGVKKIYMTNSPFDELEQPVWMKGFRRDPRFEAGLRIDPLVLNWPETARKLVTWNYEVSLESPNQKTFDEVRRFLSEWTDRIRARYVMISLPPDFQFPRLAADSADANPASLPSHLRKGTGRTTVGGGASSRQDLSTLLLEKAVLPHCQEHGLPLAVMPGVKRAVNPQLKLAGDGVGWSDLTFLQNLCAAYPENRFMATILARENQHEACVLARKFRNLHIFGCWWFTNVPSLVEEITRMRFELLGLSFTPQHSDARVLEQLVYKWHHSRNIIARVLSEKYSALEQTGWRVTPAEIERDVKGLFGGEFERFCAGAEAR
jgi:hypothetical protein